MSREFHGSRGGVRAGLVCHRGGVPRHAADRHACAAVRNLLLVYRNSLADLVPSQLKQLTCAQAWGTPKVPAIDCKLRGSVEHPVGLTWPYDAPIIVNLGVKRIGTKCAPLAFGFRE